MTVRSRHGESPAIREPNRGHGSCPDDGPTMRRTGVVYLAVVCSMTACSAAREDRASLADAAFYTRVSIVVDDARIHGAFVDAQDLLAGRRARDRRWSGDGRPDGTLHVGQSVTLSMQAGASSLNGDSAEVECADANARRSARAAELPVGTAVPPVLRRLIAIGTSRIGSE